MYQAKIISTTHRDFITSLLEKFASELGVALTTNPDLFEVRAESKQSIGINQMRTLKNWLLLKPFKSKAKIAIIYQAELLTKEAQNSILKCLEEPPVEVLLILITDNYKKLLPTIISRCQLLEHNFHSETSTGSSLPSATDTMNLLEKLAFVDKILTGKDSAKQLLEINELLVSLAYTNRAGLFHATKAEKARQNLELISETWEKIKKNVSKRLALETLIINLQ